MYIVIKRRLICIASALLFTVMGILTPITASAANASVVPGTYICNISWPVYRYLRPPASSALEWCFIAGANGTIPSHNNAWWVDGPGNQWQFQARNPSVPGEGYTMTFTHDTSSGQVTGCTAKYFWADGDEVTAACQAQKLMPTCRIFTSSAAYIPANIGTDLPNFVPAEIAAQIQSALQGSVAYMQLKGTWCFRGGIASNRVITYKGRGLQTTLSGGGALGFLFKMKPVTTGSLSVEDYGSGTGSYQASRYRISQTKAAVYIYAPVDLTLPVPGTDQVFKVAAGTEWKVYDLVMDTLLTGEGNASCAGTQFGPCTIVGVSR
jgi:hypothetical protein